MAYADYEYYTDVFKGSVIAEEDFDRDAERASEYIDYITTGRATPTDEVKRACCAMAEIYDISAKAQSSIASSGGELASQTVGSWSASYRSGAEIAGDTQTQLYGVATRYLARTGLLYRGGRCTCTHRTP